MQLGSCKCVFKQFVPLSKFEHPPTSTFVYIVNLFNQSIFIVNRKVNCREIDIEKIVFGLSQITNCKES